MNTEQGKVICKYEDIKPDEEQIKVLLAKTNLLMIKRGQGEVSDTIIRKNNLGKYDAMSIEFKNRRFSTTGLVDVKVDEEKNELTGIRVLVRNDGEKLERRFTKYTLSLDEYRKTWRAWDGLPDYRGWR